MYDTFREMVNDIFENEDFIQYCYINGFQYKCIASHITGGEDFTIAGLVDMVNFYLDIQVSDIGIERPKPNDKVIFRDKTYKVSQVDEDSALATIRLYLISTSKGK